MTAQRRTPKKIGWIVFGILILILFAGYNFLLSQFMIRNLWLPMAERIRTGGIGNIGLSVFLTHAFRAGSEGREKR